MKWLGERLLEACAVVGAALITYGAAQIFPPAGFITAGLFLLAGAWMIARKSAG